MVVIAWAIIAVCGVIFSSWYFSNHSISETVSLLQHSGGVSWQSVLFLLILYCIRTIIFIPLSIVLIATPIVLGDFWWAVGVAGVGEIISANIQFWLARTYGRDFVEESNNQTIQLINEKISRFGSVSIALLRLLPVPFDLINLGAGMTKIRFTDYFWVTLVSVWPDCVTYVAIGQSANNPLSLLYTAGTTLVVFLLIWYLKDHPEYKDMLLLEVQKKTSVVKTRLLALRRRRKIKK